VAPRIVGELLGDHAVDERAAEEVAVEVGLDEVGSQVERSAVPQPRVGDDDRRRPARRSEAWRDVENDWRVVDVDQMARGFGWRGGSHRMSPGTPRFRLGLGVDSTM